MAAREDWFWDQFDVTQKGGEFDLADTRTTFLDKQEDISRSQANEYESKFIDELYGTTDAQTIIDGENRELSQQEWVKTRYDDSSAIQTEQVDATWGLDLRRIAPTEDLKVGTQKHYEWLTRGQVDWGSYASDAAFKKAFKDMDSSGKSWHGADYAGLMNADEQDDADRWSDEARVDFIRAAQSHIKSGNSDDDPESWWTEWDNKYEPPEPRDIESPTHLPVGDFTADIRTDVATAESSAKRGSAKRAAGAAGIKIKTVNPKRPTNIPSSWGPIK
tara:strand:- start:113 stop:937 length:825 start_codon:yes stop_codon:yes gene_type:complete